MTLKKYGKSSQALHGLRQEFFAENNERLASQQQIASIYTQQPLRNNCKCCDGSISGVSFTKQKIDYIICPRCGHLNGANEDTEAFCRALYTDDGGKSYSGYMAQNYSSAGVDAYRARVENIYQPKAIFLFEALAAAGGNPEGLRYADLGAGSGYTVAALLNVGAENVRGYEVSEAQVDLGNNMIGQPVLEQINITDIADLAKSVQADVVSMIGVIEHLQNPREVLLALKENPSVRFLYLSVPLFGPTVFFEMAFTEVFQRHLSSSHTHLYSPDSLDWTCKEFGFGRVAEWWFGTDVFDLFRNISVTLAANSELEGMTECWKKMFVPLIDPMQQQIDQKRLSSEVHLVLDVQG